MLFITDIMDYFALWHEEMTPRLNLLKIHTDYLKLLVSHERTAEEIVHAEGLIWHVQKVGLLFYSRKSTKKYDKERITINSHLMRHIHWNTERIRVPRNTWTFTFESSLGVLKNCNSIHKMRYYRELQCFFYLDLAICTVLTSS